MSDTPRTDEIRALHPETELALLHAEHLERALLQCLAALKEASEWCDSEGGPNWAAEIAEAEKVVNQPS